MKKNKIWMSSLGNIIEWFDFGLFIFMAPILGKQFLPHNSELMATINALIIFAAGFLCRPLGGILFGYFGDTRGRVRVLRISIMLITLSTVMVGFLPSYETAGVFTSVFFIILRMIQGLSIGGEYTGVMIYLAESAPRKRRGFFTSFAATGANVGFLLATLALFVLNFFFGPELIKQWAWRLPFIIIGIPGVYIIYYRFKLTETPIYIELEKKNQIQRYPFKTALQYAPYQLLKIVGLTAMGSSFFYMFFGYMTHYLEHYLGFLLNNILALQMVLLVFMLFLVPLAGILGDYLSRRSLLIFIAIAIIVLLVPCFYLLDMQSTALVIVALSIATLLTSLEQGTTHTAMVENCPINIRYSSIAFSYNLGQALFGGTTPLVVTLLIERIGLLAPAFYLMLMGFITLLAARKLLPNNKTVKPILTQ